MSLINRSKVKAYTLAAAKVRAHKFTRVGRGFYDKCEAQLRQYIQGYIHRLPSKGRTIE